MLQALELPPLAISGQNAILQNPNTKKCPSQTLNPKCNGISYTGVLSVALRPDTPLASKVSANQLINLF